MSTVRQTLSLDGAKVGTTAIPQLLGTQGTNFPMTPAYAFDGTTAERLYLKFSPLAYGSGNITVTFNWYGATATSGAVVWETALAAVTPNTDTTDVETKAFATANTAADTHLGTTAKRAHSVDVTVSNLDSVAAGDWVWLRISRLPADAGDTMTGDAVLTGIDISYSDT